MDEAFALWNTVSPCGDKALAEFDLILVSLGSKQMWHMPSFLRTSTLQNTQGIAVTRTDFMLQYALTACLLCAPGHCFWMSGTRQPVLDRVLHRCWHDGTVCNATILYSDKAIVL